MIEWRDRPDADWDHRVSSSPAGSYYQTTAFARYYACLADVRPAYIVARGEDRAVRAQLLLLEGHRGGARLRSLPSVARVPLGFALRSWNRYLVWLQGPLAFDEDAVVALRAILSAVCRRAETATASVSGYPSPYGSGRERALAAFRDAASAEGFSVGDLATYVLELSGSESELWAGLRPEARTKVRRAERDGIRVRTCETDADFERFLGPIRETNRRTGIADPYRERRFRCFWEIARPAGLSRFFVSELGGTVLSAQHALLFNGIVILNGVSYTDVSRERRLYGNDLVQWHVIRWATQAGAHYIDWAGASPEDDVRSTVDAFKAKWGGTRIKLPVLSLGKPIEAALVAAAAGTVEPPPAADPG